MSRYKVLVTHKGHSAEFTADAPTGAKAVQEARRMAKAQGMASIIVNAVRQDHLVIFENDDPRPTSQHGRSLTLAQINAEIEVVLGEVPLKAYEENGRIFLGDGVNNPAQVEDPTQIGVIELLYEWAVFTGYTNEDFEDFLEAIE